MRRRLAEVLTALVVAAAPLGSSSAAEDTLRAFVGGARRGSDEDSPWSIYARFGTCGLPPANGSSITIVPKDPSLPTVAGRIESTLQIGLVNGSPGRDYGCFVFTSVISSMQWRDRLPSSIDQPWYQQVLVVLGPWPKAHSQLPNSSQRSEVPIGHRNEVPTFLLDVDGDQRADIGVWDSCDERILECPPNSCREIWIKRRMRWRRQERRCVR
jgi:hypothetical protein